LSLNYKQVEETTENVFNYLNTINLLPYLKVFKCKIVRDMMKKLEEDFLFKDEYSETLFDAVTEEEFADYLNKRYDLKIKESIVTCFYID